MSCVSCPTYIAVWRIPAHFAPPGETCVTRYGRISERRGAPCKKCTGWLLRQCLSSWYLLITCFHFCRPVVLISSCIAQFCFPEVAFSEVIFFPPPPPLPKIEITQRALPAATESVQSMQGSCWSIPDFEGGLHVRSSLFV